MAENITIARPYAKAVFELALAEKALPAWSALLLTVAEVCVDARVAKLLHDPRISSDQLFDLFSAVSEKLLTDSSRNFLRLLADNKRLAVLPEVAVLFEKLRQQHEQSIEVDVRSTIALTDEQQQRLIANLKKRLQRDVILKCEIDESLMGGAVVQAGDLVIDHSVRSMLTKMYHQLVVG